VSEEISKEGSKSSNFLLEMGRVANFEAVSTTL
jgi:hypothetical protein